MTPGELPESGVPIVGGHFSLERVDVRGRFRDGALIIDTLALSHDQSRPDLRRAERSELLHPLSEWQPRLEGWAGSPLEHETTASWTLRTGSGSRTSTALEIVLVVRWISTELATWANSEEPGNRPRVAPILTNRPEHLVV